MGDVSNPAGAGKVVVSPVDREREARVDAAIDRHGGKLSDLAVFVRQDMAGRWHVEVLSRDAMLERIDARGREWTTPAPDREICKSLAARIRGGEDCPEVVTWVGGHLQLNWISAPPPSVKP